MNLLPDDFPERAWRDFFRSADGRTAISASEAGRANALKLAYLAGFADGSKQAFEACRKLMESMAVK